MIDRAFHTFAVTVPKKLYKILCAQAQQKFRSAAEEACYLLTETLCSLPRYAGRTAEQLMQDLQEDSEKSEALKAKRREKAQAKKNAARHPGEVLSFSSKKPQGND